MREKQKAEGVASGGGSASAAGALWPPLRPAQAPPAAAGDPRLICLSGISLPHSPFLLFINTKENFARRSPAPLPLIQQQSMQYVRVVGASSVYLVYAVCYRYALYVIPTCVYVLYDSGSG